ncbi:sodium-coupled monocarboxylate transporter 1-like [Haemaphysalis longicornis]
MTQVTEYAAFLLFTGASLIIGLYFSVIRKTQPLSVIDEIFLGSKSLKTLPLGLSILASVASATGVIGYPAHLYAYGFHTGWIVVSNLLYIPIAVVLVVPVLYKLKITSIFQYVRMRYNTATSLLAAVTYILLSQMTGAVAIYASSVAMSTIFHAPAIWCSAVVGLAATVYTALGGLRGVVWADCLQGLLTLTVPMLVMVKVASDASHGHVQTRRLGDYDPSKYFFDVTVDLTTDETVWAVLVASAPMFINRVCLDQMTVQRYLASKTLKEAKRTVMIGTVMTCIFYALATGEAVALSSRYSGCDPLMLGKIQRLDQLLPFYVLEDFRIFPGLCGIFLAGVVSASVSTVSSMVNSQAAVLYMDVVTPFVKVSSTRVTFTIRMLAFAAGLIMTGFSLSVPYLGSALPMFILANAAITGPFVGLLLLGLTAPFANSKGAGTATLVMVAYQLAHMLCRLQNGMREQRMPVSIEYCPDNTTSTLNVHNVTLATSDATLNHIFPLFRFSTYWSSFISAIATYLGGLLLSIITGRNQPAPDAASNLTSALFLPLWRRLGLMPCKEQTGVTEGTTKKDLSPHCDPCERVMLTQETTL